MDKFDLFKFSLRLGDSCLIMAHRQSEMCSKGPFLEEDIAQTNLGLDLLGQAEALLIYAAKLEGKGRTADDLVYKRPERDFYNFMLTEQPNTDFITLTYKDNDVLPQTIIDELEKNREKAKTSTYWANWWKVYGLGQIGSLEGA